MQYEPHLWFSFEPYTNDSVCPFKNSEETVV